MMTVHTEEKVCQEMVWKCA